MVKDGLSAHYRFILASLLIAAFFISVLVTAADARRLRNTASGAAIGAGVGALVDGGRGAGTGAAVGAIVGATR